MAWYFKFLKIIADGIVMKNKWKMERAGRRETTHEASWFLVKISTELQHSGIADSTVNKKR